MELKRGFLMKIVVCICRFILAAGFIIFGLNILYPFLNQPPFPEGSLPAQFMTIMWPTHWMALVGIVQVVGGILVLIGRTAPLGLTLLAPVLVNILAFHTLLFQGNGIAMGLVFTALEAFLIYSYWDYFKSLCTVSAKPKCYHCTNKD
jgi:putative oxidoreductase